MKGLIPATVGGRGLIPAYHCFTVAVETSKDCVSEDLQIRRRYGPSQQQDVLGKFEIRRFTVVNDESTEVDFVIKNYIEKDIVIFEQHFTQGVKDTGYKFDPDGKENPFFYPSSAFPG